MRRLFLCGCSILLLTSCVGRSSLAPAEVLRRTVLAAGSIESAQYAGSLEWRSGTSVLRLSADGVLRDGGRLLGGAFKAERQDADSGFETEGNLILEWGRALYIQLQNAGSLNAPADSAMVMGRWYRVPLAQQPPENVALTPDPQILRAQADVLTVVRERGVERIHGHDAYRYDVVPDQAKLLRLLRDVARERGETFDEAAVAAGWSEAQMNGELWVDASTFFIHRIRWHIVLQRDVTINLDLEVSEHNRAPAIMVPTDTQPLSADALLPWFMPSIPLPLAP